VQESSVLYLDFLAATPDAPKYSEENAPFISEGYTLEKTLL
jgi:hypothetical protein